MVILKDIFNLLANGEFSNISLSQTPSGELAESEYSKIIGHLNLGLVELHKRFTLLKDEVRLHVTPEMSVYYLRPSKMATNHNMNNKTYIEGLDDNRKIINIVKILEIFDETGRSLPINDRHRIPFINEMSYDTLKITKLDSCQVLDVCFQAYPEKIVIDDDDFDAAEYEINIPDGIVEPLLYYIAARTYKPMGTNESTPSADKSTGYEQQYELACQKIDTYGLESQLNESSTSFQDNGWV